MSDDDLRDRLRALPGFPDALPELDAQNAPARPYPLVLDWLAAAIAAGERQPHAMTLATAAGDGQPSARTLLLKDITTDGDDGFWFATSSDSPKGDDIGENPRAALVFFWRDLGRQLRVTGPVYEGSAELSARDFLARHPDARAGVLTARQSSPVRSLDELQQARAIAREAIDEDPSIVADQWKAMRVQPHTVEFWQAGAAAAPTRLLYQREGEGWTRELLWS